MPKRKQDFNTIYISERLQEALRPISRCALTAVVAPMGYGKTTAVNWYLAERRKEENARIIRISVYSDNLAIFWKSVQDAFLRAGLSILLDYPCPTDAAGGSLLADDLCHALAGEKPCYLFIDDFHLLTDVHTAAFLCTLANRLPENVHVIVASRDRFLPFAAQVRLGGRLCQLGTAELRLNHAELAVYAHRCGTALSDAEISSLLYMSEGWFSAIYLHLRTLAEMEECMPHYYKITNGHGQGAEKIMSAEAYFLQGKFTDAQIALEQAYAQIEGNGQENIALCCDFLARRLSLCIETEERASFAARRAYLLKQHNIAWLNIFNATAAYYYALLGETEEIPEIFRTHTLFSVNILVPGKPMIEMVENQVYLAQGAYAKVIGRSEGLLAACAGLQYALVALHLRIQTAAAYAMLGKTEEAQALLLQALQEAEPDEFLLPFVENYRYIKKTLEKLPQTPLLARIQRLGKASEQRQKQLSTHRPASLAALTEREYEIVKLMASRLRNREIAEKLFLSEGSVKQYINQIYSKLQIEGDTHSKRKQLFQLLEEKT